MNAHEPITCLVFDDHVEDLALGHVDEPLRNQLLEHAAGCPHCHSSLESLGAVVDRLVLATPQVEPPAGFEHRVLERIHAGRPTPTPRRAVGRWIAAVAVIVVAVTASAVIFVTQLDGETTAEATRIVDDDGEAVGSALLAAEPEPHLLVTIESPRPDPGIRICELRRPDGSWEQVGWWDAGDIASGVWAVGIDPSLLTATAMRISADGDTIATATFD